MKIKHAFQTTHPFERELITLTRNLGQKKIARLFRRTIPTLLHQIITQTHNMLWLRSDKILRS